MVFSRICVNNNGDSSSFVDDSEEKMEATKRIARLSVGYMFSDDLACPSCYSQGLVRRGRCI
ncbi:hypothetical protein T4C_13630 [Trichinella pseudospiralis]|uniref:Uncharacterized protein n=1 Tax=Trichinella pseudospiralis TaxID=6337 RepID=A0A0V1GLF5_TRIPS|nr:hypothetical protein T4C_1814 [Trichinella pseudospiralis]KRZ00540.1 hypothetical protein T4C_13630 [Trichinella pseudospiralis]